VRFWLSAACVLAFAAAGCGGTGPAAPTIRAAKTFHLEGFTPTSATAGKSVMLRFRIITPSGAPLTSYRKGEGPHTGADVIMVPRTLDALIYTDTDPGADGDRHHEEIFPTAGAYHVVVDAYPAQSEISRPNFQLMTKVAVSGARHASLPAPSTTTVVANGYRFTIAPHAPLHALQATLLSVVVTAPDGRPAHFGIYDGALAHAIFFRFGSLDYFHTHVCSPTLPACTTLVGAPPVGGSPQPGVLRLGALLPLSGTWRLFLLANVGGRDVTVPFTLYVR
jgi:hypothetical protein